MFVPFWSAGLGSTWRLATKSLHRSSRVLGSRVSRIAAVEAFKFKYPWLVDL